MNIFISGASSGIGFETAIKLSENSSNTIYATARSANKLNQLAQKAKHNNIIVFNFDALHWENENPIIQAIKKESISFDVVINNAGTLINKSFLNTTEQDFEAQWKGNVLVHIKWIKFLFENLKPGAHILNIGSMGGFQGSSKFAGLAAYSTAKSALHVLTECLAQDPEFIAKNIKINCLALGAAQTEMLEKAFPGYKAPVSAKDMGEFVADFAINGHQFYNGKILPVSLSTP